MTWKSHGLKIIVNPNLFYLLETLRVEGYWSIKHREASINNKNIPLLKKIERILKESGINYTKRLLIKIKPENQEFGKKNVKVIFDKKEISFHLERSPFDGTKKIVFQLPYHKTEEVLLKFKNKKIKVDIREGKDSIEIKCALKSFGYMEIRFHNAEFIRSIEELSEGKGSLNIRVNKFLSNFPPIFTMAAFSALIDCEGSIDFYQKFRKIRIRMFNQKYLNDWQRILTNLGVYSRCSNRCLTIEGWEDFNKLKNLGLNLFHSKKKDKWSKILNSYKRKQVSRNGALNYYLSRLKELENPITAAEFAKITNKSKRVINHHFKRMTDRNLIKIDKSNVTWKYFT